MTRPALKGVTRLFQVVAVALLSSALLALSIVCILRYEERLRPEIEAKATTVGHDMAHNVLRAAEFGGGLNAVRGVAPFFDRTLSQHHELAWVALASAEGHELVRRSARARLDGAVIDVPVPIMLDGAVLGSLHLGVRADYARQILHELSSDMLTVFGIGMLITFGLMSFVIQTGVSGRIDSFLGMVERLSKGDLRASGLRYGSDSLGRLLSRLSHELEGVHRLYRDTLANVELVGPIADHERRALLRIGERSRLDEPPVDDTPAASHLMALRLVVFVFFLAEELVRPFFPLFIKEVAGPDWAAQTTLVSLPLSLFLLVGAVAQPLGGVWIERLGRRRVFTASALLCAVGLVLTATAGSYVWLLAWRCVCAVGYGVVFVACQGFAVEHTTPATRASGMAMLVGGIMAAALCGPSIGGIIADHFGYRATLAISAGVTVAAIFAGNMLMGAGQVVSTAPKPLAAMDFVRVLSNPRMLALIVFAAVPAKVVLSGVLFYLTPMHLSSIGEPQSVVGRVMMIYGAATVLLGPFAARVADRHWHSRQWFVGAGAVVSGCGLVPLIWLPGEFWALVGGVAALGIGQALSMSPQLALVPEVAARECQEIGSAVVLGVFRLIERAGGALGPFVAGMLAEWLGNATAVAAIGQAVLVTGVLFLVLMKILPSPKSP